MANRQQVLQVLEDARERVARDWAQGRKGTELSVGMGSYCTSLALTADHGASDPVVADAHLGFVRAAGVGTTDDTDVFEATYAYNDSHTHAEVLATFDKAIATLKLEAHLEATPNADAALEIMAACDAAGGIVARYIVSQHPLMDLREITTLVSGELFYAAQDTAQACELGVKVARA